MDKTIQKITKQIVKNYQPEKIILFGSQAAGKLNKPKQTSDIDLAVIKKTKENFIQRLKKIAKIVKTWEAIDVLVYTPREWKAGLKNHYFIQEIAKTGKVIYEKRS